MKRITLTMICLLVLLISTGCWSRKELNELAIATAIAIDKHDDQYMVTVQILNPGEIAGQNFTTRVAVSSFQTTGRSIFEAIRKLTQETPRKVYLAHVRMIIIGEELAREGIRKPLDFISRDHEIRTNFYISVAKGQRGSDLLKILTAINKNPAEKIYSSLEVAEQNWAPAKGMQLDDVISMLSQEGTNPVLTGLYYKGDLSMGNKLSNVEMVDTPTKINIDHLSIFKEGKLVAWLNQDESKGYNYIRDNVVSTIGVQECGDGNVSFEMIRSTTDVQAKIKNNKPKIIIKTESEVNIGEVQCEINILDESTIKKLEKGFEENQQDKIEKAIAKAKEYKTDIFGFGEVIHRKEPKVWHSLKENWHDEHFNDLEVVIKPDIKIRRTGTITESFQDRGD